MFVSLRSFWTTKQRHNVVQKIKYYHGMEGYNQESKWLTLKHIPLKRLKWLLKRLLINGGLFARTETQKI
jgi:hypothetical protein